MSSVDHLASAQRRADGAPRFHVRAQPAHRHWSTIERRELDGGVDAELRIFLDAQLEAGDLLVDSAPGFGFVALSAVTAPSGLPSVFVLQRDSATVEAMQHSAREVNGWIEPFTAEELANGALTSAIVERLPVDARIFVHADLSTLANVLEALTPLVVVGRVAACCLSAFDDVTTLANDSASRDAAAALLRAHGFGLFELREHEGEPRLIPVNELQVDVPAIAIAGVGDTSADATESEAANAVSAAASVSFQSDRHLAPVTLPSFSFIAPFCRTGYGVAGAHLLREFTTVEAPVAYFPLGGVDRSIVHVARLDEAMARQGLYDENAPSVRLSQQFDLALHVGRGPRIGFPIFELDLFSRAERHHLSQQDRLLVTCAWARDVLLENGIWQIPIDIVPLGVDREVFHERVTPSAPPDHETRFISVGKLEARKGQLQLLRAFEAAFAPSDPVRLAFVSHNPFLDEQTFAQMAAPFRSSRMAPRITLVTSPLPNQRDLAALMASTDCGVFPARAEGWNLEGLEMLAMGKQVIATNATGHTAYMTNDNARLITIDALEDAVPGQASGRWAAWGSAQHEQLVEHLRAVHRARQSGSLVRNEAGIATAKRFSWTASANALMNSVASS